MEAPVPPTSPEEKVWADDVGIIDSEEAAVNCANTMLEQSHRILNSNEGWLRLDAPKCDDVNIESKIIPVTKLPVIRSEGRVECSADELYELLISKEGHQLLNPSADLRNYNKPFLGPFSLGPEDGLGDQSNFGNEKSRVVQLEHTRMKMPVIADREFVVANVKDGSNRALVTSSVLSSTYPGGSSHQSKMPVIATWRLVRAAIVAAYTCHPIAGEERACILKVWQWLDVGGWLPESVNRKANAQWFPPAYRRVRAYVNERM